MKATRRRQRRPDSLASRHAVEAIVTELRSRLPEIIPTSERKLWSLLQAANHVEKYPASDTKSGRRVSSTIS